jgi:RNA polymerase sigma-70 factor (ECF subfamily)
VIRLCVIFEDSGCAVAVHPSIGVDKELTLDDTTFELLQLLDEYGLRLHAMLTKITLRSDVAEDLLQELFLRLCGSDGYLRATRRDLYLFRSAINLAFDWRGRNRRSFAPLSGDEVGSQLSPLERTVRQEELERVMCAVEQLPDFERELVTLRFLHGSSYEDLAEQLGSTPHRVRARCSKAVARLRAQLGCGQVPEVTDVE